MFTKFRWGRTSTDRADCPGRPVDVSTPEIIDRSEIVREIVEAIGISHTQWCDEEA